MSELESAFDILKDTLPDYEDRPQQVEMAEEVYGCLRDGKRVLVEAGTGVGKSFAYLIPAILSNEKTVVSTASIALQDQLVHKDLLFLEKVFPRKFSYAMLKGKNNYLCLKREREYSELSDRYMEFRTWAFATESGDRDDLRFIPDFWNRVCGDSNDCNAIHCPFYSTCFYYRHYRDLFRKDIIVVNHHLLVFDLLSGFNILPFHKQLIIDEAHQIENIISHVLGSVLNQSQMVWLLYRLRGLKIAVEHLFEPVERFFKNSPSPPLMKGDKGGFEKPFSERIVSIPDVITEELRKLRDQLSLDGVIHRLNLYKESADSEELYDRAETTTTYVRALASIIDDFIAQENKDKVYFILLRENALELKSSLVEAQRPFSGLVDGYEGVVMTSATLTTGGDFSFIKGRLGVTDAAEVVIGSPFDYKRQAILYLERELPSPGRASNELFQRKSLKSIEALIAASRGRALVLFTSYDNLRFVSENVEIAYPFKSQGDMPPARLIEWFRDTPHSVLFATAAFWQGIDIKGEDLSLVIVVKMPFGSPGDPVYDERCRRLGDRWFSDLVLPSAILQLRQGLGRLIRSSRDYGVAAILDTRLVSSTYGGTVISSLPEMDIVYSVADVKRFLDVIPASSASSDAPPCTKGVKGDKSGMIEVSGDEIFHVVALGNSDDPSVIPELINRTNSENGNVRRLAASALGKLAKFKPEIYEAVEPLDGLLDDEKPQVRRYAMKALARIGKFKNSRLVRMVDNPSEKRYNVNLAKKLLGIKIDRNVRQGAGVKDPIKCFNKIS